MLSPFEEALRASHVALRRQQEIDCLAPLVDGAVTIFPDVLDLAVGLIHAPTAPRRDGLKIYLQL